MSVKLRPAQAEDLPDIAALDISAHPNFPIVTIPFAKASDCQAVFLSRYTYFFHHPEYHYIVATSGEEIVGFLLWGKPNKGVDFKEWEPQLPDGTNLKFFEFLLPAIEEEKAKYFNPELYGM